jgi:hypothetical protein
LKCGRLEEEKEMENDFSFNLYRIVCYAWRWIWLAQNRVQWRIFLFCCLKVFTFFSNGLTYLCRTYRLKTQIKHLRRALIAFNITSKSITSVFGPLREVLCYDSTYLDKPVRICVRVNMSLTQILSLWDTEMWQYAAQVVSASVSNETPGFIFKA